MQNKLFKKVASLTLAWCIAFGGMPVALMEDVPTAPDVSISTPTDVEPMPSEEVSPEAVPTDVTPTEEALPEPTPTDVIPTEPMLPEHVLYVQQLLNALPTAEALATMDAEAMSVAYDQTEAAYDAYLMLTAEEQALVTGVDAFPALFAVFGAQASTLEASTISFTYKYYAEANSNALSTINGTADAADNKTFFGWLQEQGHSTSNCQYLVKHEGVISPVTSATLLQADAEYYLFCRIETDTYAHKNLMIYHTCNASDISLSGYDFVSTGTDIITGSAATVTLTHTLAGLPHFALYTVSMSGSKLTVGAFALQSTANFQLSDGMAWYDSNAKSVQYISLSEQCYTAGYAVYTTTFPGELQFSPELPGQHSESNGQFSFTGYAASGTEIQMTVPQNSGKKLVPLVKNVTTNEMVTLTEISDNVYQFIMPAGVIRISNNEVTAYPVTIGKFEHGKVTANVSHAAVGETVTLTVTPDTDYVLDTLAVKNTSTREPIALTPNEDGTYSFLMAEEITITATFKAAYINFSIRGTNSTTTNQKAENDGTTFLNWLSDNKISPSSTSIACWRVTTDGKTEIVNGETAIIEGAEYRLLYHRTNDGNDYLLTIYDSCSAETLNEMISSKNMRYNYLVIPKQSTTITFNLNLDGEKRKLEFTGLGAKKKVLISHFIEQLGLPDGAVLYNESGSSVRNNSALKLSANDASYVTHYSIKTNETTNGTISVMNAENTTIKDALPGDIVTVKLTPAEGYEVESFIVTAGEDTLQVTKSADNPNVYTFTMPRIRATITATFKEASVTPYAITTNTPSNGTIAVTNAAGEAITEALPGDTVTITLTPDENYGVDTLAVTTGENSVAVTASNKYTFTMPNAPVNITATFKRCYNISLRFSTTEGNVTCDKTVAAAGETVTLTIVPDSDNHYVMDKITIQNGKISCESIGDNKYTFIMPDAKVTVTVKFVQKYAVAVEQTTGGTVEISLSDDADFSGGPILVEPNDLVYIKVTPDESYTFGGASSITILDASTKEVLGISLKSSSGIYRFSMPRYELLIHADFVSTEENASINIIGKDQPETTYKAPEGTKFLAWTASKGDTNLFSTNDTWQWRMTLNDTTRMVDENTLIVSGATYTLMYVVSSSLKKLYIYHSCDGSDFVNAPPYTSFRLMGDETAVTLTHTIDGTQYTKTITNEILKKNDLKRDEISVFSFATLCGLPTDGRVWFTEGATTAATYLLLTPQSYTTYSQLHVSYALYNIQNITFSPEEKVRGTGSYSAPFYYSSFSAIASKTIDDEITMTLHPVEGQECKFILTSSATKLPGNGNSYTFTVPETGLTITPSYLITTTAEHGTITLTGTRPTGSSYCMPDRTVSFAVEPEEGYVLDTVTVINESNNGAITATNNSFTMPNSPVTITATFKEAPYAITTNAPTKGTIAVTNATGEAITSASSGDTVTITLTPNESCELKSLTVKAGEDDVTVTPSADNPNVYTFTMPTKDVHITAIFAYINGFAYWTENRTAPVPDKETPFLTWLNENHNDLAKQMIGWHVVRDGKEEVVNSETIIKKDDFFAFAWQIQETTLFIYRSCSADEIPLEYLKSVNQLHCNQNQTLTVTHTVDGVSRDFVITNPYDKWYTYFTDGERQLTWYYNGKQLEENNTLPYVPGVIATQHSISVTPIRNITATIKNAEGDTIDKALTGDTVTVTLTSEAPTEIIPTGLSVTDSEGNAIPCTSGENGYTFTMPAKDVTITPTFTLQEGYYTITLVQPAHGTISCNPTTYAFRGQEVSLTYQADEGYDFGSWICTDADGNSISAKAMPKTDKYGLAMPDANLTITAAFGRTKIVQLSTPILAKLNGKVSIVGVTQLYTVFNNQDTSSSTLPAGTYQIEYEYARYADAKLYDTPSSDTFTVEEDGSITSDREGFVTIDSQSGVVYLHPAFPTYTVSIAENAHGTVTADKTAPIKGETVTLTVTPADKYALRTLSVTDSEGNVVAVTQQSDGTYTFTMPGSAVSVNTQFVACHTITIAETTGGTVTTSPEGAATAGTSVTVSISPDSTYRLVSVTVQDANGAPLMVLDNCFIMPDSDVTITATFANPQPMPLPTSFTVIGKNGESIPAEASNNGTTSFHQWVTSPSSPDDFNECIGEWSSFYWRVQRANGLTETVTENTIIQRDDIYTLVAQATDLGLDVYANCTAEELPGKTFRTVLATIYNNAIFTVIHTVDGNDVTFTITDSSTTVRDAFNQHGINGYLEWKVGNDTVNMNAKLPLTKTTYTSVPNSAKYPVTIGINGGQGTVTVNGQSTGSSYAEGTVMTVVATPATGWKVTSLSCYYAEGQDFVQIPLSENNTFTMPAKEVSVSVTFSPTDPTYTITIPASVSLNSGADLTVTASDVTNLGAKAITVTASSQNGTTAGNGMMLLPGDTRYGLAYTFTPSLTFTQSGNQSLGLALQEGATAGKPAGTYTDTLTLSVALTTTSNAGD